MKFRLTLCNFFRVRIALKKFTQVLSYVFCTQVRRHVHKQITEGRYGEEKPGRFVFGKPILLTLGLGLTASYSLGILVWNFYKTFIIVSIEFWVRFEPQTRPTRFTINFLFITALAERKVRLCVKLFDSFPGWILIRLTWNTSRFSQIQWRFLRGISGKNDFGRIFQEFCANQGYPPAKLVKFRPTFCNFFPSPYCAEKIHTSTFVCFLRPGKEARPKTNHRKNIRGTKARTFCFWKTESVHSRFGTYCAFLLGYFGTKFIPDIRHCVYWV